LNGFLADADRLSWVFHVPLHSGALTILARIPASMQLRLKGRLCGLALLGHIDPRPDKAVQGSDSAK
jgi:hypothetical protein